MGSLNARAVALEAVETIVKGQKVNHRSLLKKHGYSQSIADRPDKVINTKSYQEVIQQALRKMENIRLKSLIALEKKDLNKEKYRDLITGVDVITRNTQLLGGKSTDNVAINVSISEQIGNKYAEMSREKDNQPQKDT